MAQIFDPLPSDGSHRIVCCYVNASSKIQIARITNVSNWYFERVVFPGQRLIFEALPEAQLEIHTGMMASAVLSDTILCDRLRVDPEPQTEPDVELARALCEELTENQNPEVRRSAAEELGKIAGAIWGNSNE